MAIPLYGVFSNGQASDEEKKKKKPSQVAAQENKAQFYGVFSDVGSSVAKQNADFVKSSPPPPAPTPAPVQKNPWQQIGDAISSAVQKAISTFAPQQSAPATTPTPSPSVQPPVPTSPQNSTIPTSALTPAVGVKQKSAFQTFADTISRAPIDVFKDYLAKPQEEKNIAGQVITQGLANAQQTIDAVLTASPLLLGFEKGAAGSYLGSNKAYADYMNTTYPVPKDKFGQAQLTAGEIVGQVVAFAGGGSLLKGVGLGRAALPILFTGIGQLSAPAETSLKQRLAKAPVDLLTGYLFGKVPVSNKVLSKETLKGAAAAAAIVAPTSFISYLIQGMKPADAAKVAAQAAVVQSLFHVAMTGINQATSAQVAQKEMVMTPEQIRQQVASTEMPEKMAKDLTDLAAKAEVAGKDVKISAVAVKPAPISKVIGTEATEKLTGQPQSITVVDGQGKNIDLNAQLVDKTEIKLISETAGEPPTAPPTGQPPTTTPPTTTDIVPASAPAVETKPVITNEIPFKLSKAVSAYISDEGVYKKPDGTLIQTPALQELTKLAETPEGQQVAQDKLIKAIENNDIKPNPDATITVYRVGSIRPEDNRLVSVSFDKAAAESFAQQASVTNTPRPINEATVKQSDVKVFIGGTEKELLVPASALAKTPETKAITVSNVSDAAPRQALIDTAKSYGVDSVIPNDKQLEQWTINQVMSGDKTVLAHLERVMAAGKPIPVGEYIRNKVVSAQEKLQGLHDANPQLFNTASKSKTLDEFLKKMGTPDKVDYKVLTDFYNKVKGTSEGTTASKPKVETPIPSKKEPSKGTTEPSTKMDQHTKRAIEKAKVDIEAAKVARESAPATVTPEQAIFEGIKDKKWYDDYIKDVERWIAKKEGKAKPPSGFGNADMGGYADVTEPPKTDYNTVAIEMPELVRLARDLMGQAPIVETPRFRPTIGGRPRGFFVPAGNGKIVLNPEIFKDPIGAAKTLAHEIGHLTDYLPDHFISGRGNILGRIASLRRYMSSYLESYAGAPEKPLTDNEKRAIEKKAKAEVKALNPKELTPQDVLDIWNKVEVANKPLESYIAKLNTSEKKDILKAALKGTIPEWVNFAPPTEGWKDVYARLLREEIVRRGLYDKKVVMDELKTLTQMWKPFDDKASASFTAYRYSPPELYADAISVLFNNPALLKAQAPEFYRGFFSYIDSKPEIKAEFFKTWDLVNLGADAVGAQRNEDVRNMFATADETFRAKLAEKQRRNTDFLFKLKYDFIDRNQKVIDKIAEAKKAGKIIPDDANPQYMLEEYNYVGGQIKGYVEKYIQPIYQDLQKNGVDWADFGQVLFYERVMNERGDLANPLGFSPKTAGDQLEYLKKQLGDRYAVIERNLPKFREAVKFILPEAEKVGLYKKELIEEMKANPAYATYQVIDYMDVNIPSSIKHQVGTLKEIANPASATVIKTISIMKAIERNRVKLGIVDFLKTNFPDQIVPAKTAWNGHAHIPIESKDREQALFTTMENGKFTGYYVDPYIASTMDYMSTGHVNAALATLKFLNSKQFRPLFITFNLGFQSFNAMRDFLRFYKNVPNMTLLRALNRYREALPTAVRRAWDIPDKTIQEMEASKLLSVTMNDVSKGMTEDDGQIEYVLKRVGLLPIEEKASWFRKTIDPVLTAIERTGNTIETLSKVAGYNELKGTMPAHEFGNFLRTSVGSPDFLRKGAAYQWSNDVFLFSNAIKEGLRSDYNVAINNPRTRAGWWWKTTVINFLPKLLMFAASIGLMGAALKRMFAGVSEYDKTNYTVIPMGMDGDKTIYLRVPQDETGRLLGGFLWKVMALATAGNLPKLSDVADLSSFMAGQVPSLTPALTMLFAIGQFMTGQNPYDFYRSRNVLTDQEFQAGGMYAAKPFFAWLFNSLGGGVFYQAAMGTAGEKKSTLQKFLELPVLSNILGRWVKVSNYGITEANRQITGEVTAQKAAASIERRQKLNDAIKEYQKSDKSLMTRTRMEKALVESVIGKIKDAGDKTSATLLVRQFRQGIIKGQADPWINSLISATSNDAKVALLKEAKATLSNDDFYKMLREARDNSVISEDVIKELAK